MPEVKERIRAYLIWKKITMISICENLGYSHTGLWHILHGRGKLTMDTYQRICDVLDLPEEFFLGKNGDWVKTPAMYYNIPDLRNYGWR